MCKKNKKIYDFKKNKRLCIPKTSKYKKKILKLKKN